MAKKKKSGGKYEADLVKTYHQISGKPKKSGKKIFTTILIIAVCACFIVAGALAAYLYFFSGVTPGLIMNNVSVLGVNVGGLSKNDALITLQTAFDEEYCKEMMVVTILDRKAEITADTIGLTLDAEGAIEAAYDLGRTGSQAKRKMEQAEAALAGLAVDTTDFLYINEDSLKSELDNLCQLFPAAAVDGTWELVSERPDLTTEEVPASSQSLKINMGAQGYEIDQDALLEQVKEGYASCDFQVRYTCTVLDPAPVDLDKVYEEVCTTPVDAVMDPETFEVSAHAYGYTFDLVQAKGMQQQTPFEKSFEIAFSATAPTHTKQGLESILFRDVLGTYTAYSSSDPANRDVNLRLSCQAINGIVLLPDEIFSYNPALGKRTPEAGWKQADGYVGSETRKEYGGGICQASSCLYLSAMKADLEIVERVNHGFISSYMPYGMDATVSWGGPEFRFKNNTEYPIRIEATASGGAVTVKLVGTDTKDYYVKMTYEVLSTDPYETVYKEMEEDNEKGYKDGEVITSGYTGYKIRTYRCKYSKATDELISSEVEATSTYDRRDKVVCKIKKDETTEPSTEAPTEVPPAESTEPPVEETTVPVAEGPVTEDG